MEEGASRQCVAIEGTQWHALPETGTLDGVVFALLGLLIAFTFSGAVTRFEARLRRR